MFYTSVAMDNMETFLGHCRSLFTIPRSRYLSRRDLQQRKQRSDEPVRTFVADLCHLIGFCDYGAGEIDERLKENLIINAYSSETRKKLYTMPDATDLKDIIVAMETLEQAMRESKISENAIGKTPLWSAHLQAEHRYRGRRDSESADSDVDYISEYGVQSINFGLDELANSSDDDFQQKISTLETQLA